MLNRLTSPLLLGLSLAAGGLMACGDSSGDTGNADDTTSGDGDTGDGDGDSGDGDGDSGDGDGDSGDGDGDTGDGDGDTGDGDGDTGDGDGDTGDGDGDGDCMVWEINYDLTGSEFEISGTPASAGDQVNVVEEPYDDDDHIGPGNFILQFNDVDGAPGGNVYMIEYFLDLEFTVVSIGATVNTDLVNTAGPVECGITSATLEGTTANWNPLAIVDQHSMGQILCMGGFCGLGGLPDGMPVLVDDTADQALEPWQFANGFGGFNMPAVLVQMDQNSTTEILFEGTEVSRELVPAPACLCE